METIAVTIDKVSGLFDGYIQDMDRIAIKLLFDNALMTTKLNQHVYNEIEAIERLSYYQLAVPFVDEVILINEEGVLYTSIGKYDQNVYIEHVLRADSSILHKDESELQYPSVFIVSGSGVGQVLYKYPGLKIENANRQVFFRIAQSTFIDSVNKTLPFNSLVAAVLDSNGGIVFWDSVGMPAGITYQDLNNSVTTRGNQPLEGEDYFLFSVRNAQDLHIFITTEKEPLAQTLLRFRNSSLWMIVFLILVCVTSLLVMTKLSYVPLKGMLSKMKIQKQYVRQNGNELDHIVHTYEQSLREQKRYKEELDEQRDLIHGYLFEKLLGEVSLTEHETDILGFRGEYYCSIAALRDDFEYIGRIKPRLIDTVPGVKADIYVIERFIDNQLHILFTLEDNCRAAVELRISEIVSALHPRQTRFGVGTVVDDLEMLYHSSLESICALRCCDTPEGIVFFCDISEKESDENYGSRAKLYQAVDNGFESIVLRELNDILTGYMENDEDFGLLQYKGFRLIVECEPVLSRWKLSLESEWLAHVLRCTDLSQLSDTLHRLFAMICALIKKEQMAFEKNLTDQIIGFVNENYTDPYMCLEMMCERFNMIDYTISRLFKDTVGINFKRYITDKRMERAKELLLTSDDNLQDIAIQSGFTSASYFIRIFKTMEDSTPQQFRNKNKNSKAV